MENVSELPIFIDNKPKANEGDLILYEDQIYIIEKVNKIPYTKEELEWAKSQVLAIRKREGNNDATSNSFHYSYVPKGLNIEIGQMSSRVGIEEINAYLKMVNDQSEYYRNQINEIKNILE